VAAVAVARKLAVLAWHLLSSEEDYAFARPALVRQKMRKLKLRAGAPRIKPGPKGKGARRERDDARAREVAEQAEHAYRRLVADRVASGPGKGAGATTGRAY